MSVAYVFEKSISNISDSTLSAVAQAIRDNKDNDDIIEVIYDNESWRDAIAAIIEPDYRSEDPETIEWFESEFADGDYPSDKVKGMLAHFDNFDDIKTIIDFVDEYGY